MISNEMMSEEFQYFKLCTLSYEQMDASFLANNSQHCWMLHVASDCTPCSMLLRKV